MGSGQWQALLGVLVGAVVIASVRLVGLSRGRGDSRDITRECATLITLSEDLQRRIRAEDTALAVTGWDSRVYRGARSRLTALGPPPPVQAALRDLDEARQELTTAWRLSGVMSAGEPFGIHLALREHATAIEHFATASSILVRITWPYGQAA